MSKQKFRHKNTPFFVFSYQYPINSFKSFALTVRNFSLSSLIILVSMYLDTQLVLCPLTVNYRIIEQLYSLRFLFTVTYTMASHYQFIDIIINRFKGHQNVTNSCFYGKLLSVYSFIWSSNEMTYNAWWTQHSRGLTSENLSTALLTNHLNFIRKNPPLNASFPCHLSSSRFRVDDLRVFQYKEAIQSLQWVFNLDCEFFTFILLHPKNFDPDSIHRDCTLW